jgi:hypothetical protein
VQTSEHIQKDFRALLGQLRSSDGNERKNACKALGKMAISGETYVIGPLIRLTSNPDYLVRYNACEALGNIGEPRALKPIINLLKDEEEWVRESACRALGIIGDSRAIEPLLERLSDSFEKVRNAALKSLISLGEGRLAKAIKDSNFAMLLRLARSGDPRPIDKILEILKKNFDDKQFQTDIKPVYMDIHKRFTKKQHGLLCVEHFHRFTEFRDPDLKIGMKTKLPYFACRKCRKTTSGKIGITRVIAILDDNCDFEISFDNNQYMINYFSFNHLFDFNQVEIINTTDKVIEQFCYKVSRDTDAVRKKAYRKVKCLVSPNSGISNWSKKILKDVFGEK